MAMDGNKSAVNPFQHLVGRLSRINRLILRLRPGPQVIYIVLKLPGRAGQFAPKMLHVLLKGRHGDTGFRYLCLLSFYFISSAPSVFSVVDKHDWRTT